MCLEKRVSFARLDGMNWTKNNWIRPSLNITEKGGNASWESRGPCRTVWSDAEMSQDASNDLPVLFQEINNALMCPISS